MKAIGKLLLLTAVLTLSLCVSAMAAGADSGIFNVKVEDGYDNTVTVTPNTDAASSEKFPVIEGTTVTNFYPNAEKVTVTFNNAMSGKYYLILAQDADGVPTAENIKYIDQDTATETSVSFDVFPSSLENGKTYFIYLASNNDTSGARAKIASFQYYVPYVLGDVDENGSWNSADALMALQIGAKLITPTDTQFLAADVTCDDQVNSLDALQILRYAAKLIQTWDE